MRIPSLLFPAVLLLAAGVAAQDVQSTPEEFQTALESKEAPALESEAAQFRAAIEALRAERDALEAQLADAADEDQAGLQKQLDGKQAEIDLHVERMQLVVARLDDLGGDVADEQAFLTKTTGKVDVRNLSTGMAVSLVGGWLQDGKDYLVEEGPAIVANLAVFLVILLVFLFLSRIVGGITHRTLSSSKLTPSALLAGFAVNIVKKIVLAIGLLVALPYIGIDVGPFLAGVGVAGFVIGFALQDTLANFAAGIMILLYRPFDVGDFVDAGGVTGKVMAMSLVSTTFHTPDHQKVVVPNGSIWGGTITNVTANPTRRVDMTIGVGYGDDLSKAQEVLMDELVKHPKVLKDPEPVVKCANLGESSVDFVVRPWCKTADYWDVKFDLTKSIKERLDAEGLNIPFPQRDVHLFQQQA